MFWSSERASYRHQAIFSMMAVCDVYRLHRFLNATWKQIIVFKKMYKKA